MKNIQKIYFLALSSIFLLCSCNKNLDKSNIVSFVEETYKNKIIKEISNISLTVTSSYVINNESYTNNVKETAINRLNEIATLSNLPNTGSSFRISGNVDKTATSYEYFANFANRIINKDIITTLYYEDGVKYSCSNNELFICLSNSSTNINYSDNYNSNGQLNFSYQSECKDFNIDGNIVGKITYFYTTIYSF